jgi:hypothetical protein
MAMEFFSRKVRQTGSPSAAFTKMGRVAFNIMATANFEKKGVECVLLGWDKERRLVGIKPISITKKDLRAYKLRAGGKKGNGSGFTASTFLRHIGFDLSETKSMPIEWDDKEEMFLVEVPEEYLKKDQPAPDQKTRKIRIGSLKPSTAKAEKETP